MKILEYKNLSENEKIQALKRPAIKAKDDIVKIVDEKGANIGMGKVQYNSSKARELIGLKNQKPMVHYDYLYME